MRIRNSMGKMVNKLTKRELAESFALIDRIARGADMPHSRTFIPKVVTNNNNILKTEQKQENTFYMQEQTADNVVIMRESSNQAQKQKAEIIFPDAFYEYFEIINSNNSKAC